MDSRQMQETCWGRFALTRPSEYTWNIRLYRRSFGVHENLRAPDLWWYHHFFATIHNFLSPLSWLYFDLTIGRILCPLSITFSPLSVTVFYAYSSGSSSEKPLLVFVAREALSPDPRHRPTEHTGTTFSMVVSLWSLWMDERVCETRRAEAIEEAVMTRTNRPLFLSRSSTWLPRAVSS